MAKSVLHVVPHNDEWAVKREGNERASSTHPTQKEAIDSAREMAKELDDIVIHRADGTIRERVTYFGTNGQPQPNGEAATTPRAVRSEGEEVSPEDVVGVGSRVSWGAVVGGALTAVAAYITLSLFALALGLTVSDQMWGRDFSVTAAVVSAVIMLLSLFLGGYVASAATAGEQPSEAGLYGVLVWGVVFVILATGAVGFGFGHLSGMRQFAPAPDAAANARQMQTELGLTPEQTQKYEARLRAGTTVDVRPRDAAWWAFGGVALSLAAAIGGSLVGAGPEWALRRRTSDTPAAVAVPKPA